MPVDPNLHCLHTTELSFFCPMSFRHLDMTKILEMDVKLSCYARHLKMGAYSITAVHTCVHTYVPIIGFRSLSFEKISILDSYFIHRYIIIKYRSTLNLGKIRLFFVGVMAPLQLYCLVKKVSIHYYLKTLVYSIHILYEKYIIIKYRSSSNLGIIHLLLWE